MGNSDCNSDNTAMKYGLELQLSTFNMGINKPQTHKKNLHYRSNRKQIQMQIPNQYSSISLILT
jgi:hypothetical protein